MYGSPMPRLPPFCVYFKLVRFAKHPSVENAAGEVRLCGGVTEVAVCLDLVDMDSVFANEDYVIQVLVSNAS